MEKREDVEEKSEPLPVQNEVAIEKLQEETYNVRRSIFVPRVLITNPEGPFDELGDTYSVKVFKDPARRKLHIIGNKNKALECLEKVKALLAEFKEKGFDRKKDAEIV